MDLRACQKNQLQNCKLALTLTPVEISSKFSKSPFVKHEKIRKFFYHTMNSVSNWKQNKKGREYSGSHIFFSNIAMKYIRMNS